MDFWGLVIIVVIAFLLIRYLIKKRNEFNALRHKVTQQGSDIGIHISKRTALLSDALNIAKLAHEKEVSGIEKLTASDQLQNLAYLGQKYPSLQNTGNYTEALRQAMELDKDIAASRELLNRDINIYNEAITTFPGLLVAMLFGYKKEKLIDEDNIEQNKMLDKSDVDFSKF